MKSRMNGRGVIFFIYRLDLFHAIHPRSSHVQTNVKVDGSRVRGPCRDDGCEALVVNTRASHRYALAALKTLGQSSPEILHATDGVLDSSKNGIPSAHILLSKQINNNYCDLRGGHLLHGFRKRVRIPKRLTADSPYRHRTRGRGRASSVTVLVVRLLTMNHVLQLIRLRDKIKLSKIKTSRLQDQAIMSIKTFVNNVGNTISTNLGNRTE